MKFTNLLLSATFVISMTLSLSVPADAGNRHPVIEAAQQYRDTVRDFERIVFRTPAMGHHQRQAADRFELQANRVLSRARDYRRPERLRAEFEQAKLLCMRAESVVFVDHNCPSRIVLAPVWQAVLATGQRLEAELCALESSILVPSGPDCWTPPIPPCFNSHPTHPNFNGPAAGYPYGPTSNEDPNPHLPPWSTTLPHMNSNEHSSYNLDSRAYRRQVVAGAVIGALLSRTTPPGL
jgi:hypothetical protein